jgi:cell division septal protein FtsQ
MWGGKKSKRSEQTEASFSDDRPVRKKKKKTRWLWRLFWCLILISIPVSAYYLGVSTLNELLEKTVYTNRIFTVRKVDVKTFGGITEKQVRDFLGIEEYKDNLMALDLKMYRRKLGKLSGIEKYELKRVIPDTLKVEIYGRTPLVRCLVWETDPETLTEGVWTERYLDGLGFVIAQDEIFFSVDPLEEIKLPILTGVSDKNILVPNRRCESKRVQNALKFVRLYRHSPFFEKDPLAEVNLGEPGIIIAQTEKGVEAVFDENRLEQGLARWYSIASYGADIERRVKTIDLSVTNNVPVVWFPEDGDYIIIRRSDKNKPRSMGGY